MNNTADLHTVLQAVLKCFCILHPEHLTMPHFVGFLNHVCSCNLHSNPAMLQSFAKQITLRPIMDHSSPSPAHTNNVENLDSSATDLECLALGQNLNQETVSAYLTAISSLHKQFTIGILTEKLEWINRPGRMPYRSLIAIQNAGRWYLCHATSDDYWVYDSRSEDEGHPRAHELLGLSDLRRQTVVWNPQSDPEDSGVCVLMHVLSLLKTDKALERLERFDKDISRLSRHKIHAELLSRTLDPTSQDLADLQQQSGRRPLLGSRSYPSIFVNEDDVGIDSSESSPLTELSSSPPSRSTPSCASSRVMAEEVQQKSGRSCRDLVVYHEPREPQKLKKGTVTVPSRAGGRDRVEWLIKEFAGHEGMIRTLRHALESMSEHVAMTTDASAPEDVQLLWRIVRLSHTREQLWRRHCREKWSRLFHEIVSVPALDKKTLAWMRRVRKATRVWVDLVNLFVELQPNATVALCAVAANTSLIEGLSTADKAMYLKGIARRKNEVLPVLSAAIGVYRLVTGQGQKSGPIALEDYPVQDETPTVTRQELETYLSI